MRSDCPSIPTRGSRFAGLLSIIITSALRSGFPEQESAETSASRTKTSSKVVIASEEADPAPGSESKARRSRSRPPQA